MDLAPILTGPILRARRDGSPVWPIPFPPIPLTGDVGNLNYLTTVVNGLAKFFLLDYQMVNARLVVERGASRLLPWSGGDYATWLPHCWNSRWQTRSRRRYPSSSTWTSSS